MNKDILIKVMDRLKQEVKELRWIDIEAGQLNALERPPIAYPACLVDMAYIQCEALSGARQRVTVELRLSLVFQQQGATSSAAPSMVREKALSHYDIAEHLHEALQWWTAEGLWMPIKRISIRPNSRRDGLKIFDAIYHLTYIDAVATQR